MTEEEIEEIKKLPLTKIIDEFYRVKIALDSASAVKSELQSLYDAYRIVIVPDMMEAGGSSCIHHTFLGKVNGRIHLSGDLYAYILAANRKLANDWLCKNGCANLIDEVVSESKLKTLAMKKIKEGNSLPANIFKITPYSKAIITIGDQSQDN